MPARSRAYMKCDIDLPVDDLRALVQEYKAIIRTRRNVSFPDDPSAQLWGAIEAMFKSWRTRRAVDYRRVHGIPDAMGTAVNSPIKKRLLDAYGVGMALALLLAFALPTWYRIRLGPRLGEYEALVPIGEWLDEHTDARPGTRVWILPSGDPTDNFYAIHGYLPPLYWSQTYPWFQAVPGQTERVIAALDADPPRYAILVERWEPEIPERLLEYLDSHYTPTGSFDPGYEYGLTTFYELSPSD